MSARQVFSGDAKEASPSVTSLNNPSQGRERPCFSHRLSLYLGEAFAIPEHLLYAGQITLPTSSSPQSSGTAVSIQTQNGSPLIGQRARHLFFSASQAFRDLCRASIDGGRSSNLSPQSAPAVDNLGRCLVNEQGSRFSEDLAKEGEDIVFASREVQITRAVRFRADTVEPEHPPRPPVRPPTPPAIRPPTPPRGSRRASNLMKVDPWDMEDVERVITIWITEFDEFRTTIKGELEKYFTKWTERIVLYFSGARCLLKMLNGMERDLRKLSHTLALHPHRLGNPVAELDEFLRNWFEEAQSLYRRMSQRNTPMPTPLEGKELAWRKHNIKQDLGPKMGQLAEELANVQKWVREMRRSVMQDVEKCFPGTLLVMRGPCGPC